MERERKPLCVGRIVMNTIRKYGNNGVSLVQLKKQLKDVKKLDIAVYEKEIKLALQNGVNRGTLSKQGELYKVVLRPPRRRRVVLQKVTCTICLREWSPTCKRLVTTPCNHQFCNKCLENWKRLALTCPNCRCNL